MWCVREVSARGGVTSHMISDIRHHQHFSLKRIIFSFSIALYGYHVIKTFQAYIQNTILGYHSQHHNIQSTPFNPYLNWGGGGQFDPPARNQRLPRDRRRSRQRLSWLFSFKSYASFDTKFAKSDHRREVTGRFVLARRPKFAQNPHFAYVCVQNTWKLLIFLNALK